MTRAGDDRIQRAEGAYHRRARVIGRVGGEVLGGDGWRGRDLRSFRVVAAVFAVGLNTIRNRHLEPLPTVIWIAQRKP
jgi:hypothetical protein